MEVRITFLTILAVKDPDHVVRLPIRRLCKKANLSGVPEENERLVREALKVLLEPDRRGGGDEQPFQGRRLEEVRREDGTLEGWLVLNGEHYREEMFKLMTRLRKTQWQREARRKEKQESPTAGKRVPSGREKRFIEAVGEGDEAKADRIVAEGLPEGSGIPSSNGSGALPRPAAETLPMDPGSVALREKMAAAIRQAEQGAHGNPGETPPGGVFPGAESVSSSAAPLPMPEL